MCWAALGPRSPPCLRPCGITQRERCPSAAPGTSHCSTLWLHSHPEPHGAGDPPLVFPLKALVRLGAELHCVWGKGGGGGVSILLRHGSAGFGAGFRFGIGFEFGLRPESELGLGEGLSLGSGEGESEGQGLG